jgi:tagaturonate reductase
MYLYPFLVARRIAMTLSRRMRLVFCGVVDWPRVLGLWEARFVKVRCGMCFCMLAGVGGDAEDAFMANLVQLDRKNFPQPVFPERVIQFGGGAFLRGFADWMIHRLNVAGRFGGSIVIVQSTTQGKSQDINQQEGLYTVITRGIEKGKTIDSSERVASVSRSIDARGNWGDVLACARKREIRYAFSNTTEAGIVASKTDQMSENPPESFPSKLTAYLFERFKALGGTDDAGMIILPCELIDDNADTLQRTVLETAQRWKLPADFVRWVSSANQFCNTLVDRIVSGFPAGDAEAIQAKIGYADALLDVAEPFHFWAIQAPAEVAAELPFEKIGLNVVWAKDITSYRKRKVRILNGAHTAMAMVGLLCGKETVRESIEDPIIGAYIRRAIDTEILPVLDLPESDARPFADAVMERFSNPFLQHKLMSIAMNSTSKFKARLLPTIRDYAARKGSAPELLAFALAAMIIFYRRSDIRDDAAALAMFQQVWKDHAKNPPDYARLVTQVLSHDAIWGGDLNQINGLSASVARYVGDIADNGCGPAIKALISG